MAKKVRYDAEGREIYDPDNAESGDTPLMVEDITDGVEVRIKAITDSEGEEAIEEFESVWEVGTLRDRFVHLVGAVRYMRYRFLQAPDDTEMEHEALTQELSTIAEMLSMWGIDSGDG